MKQHPRGLSLLVAILPIFFLVHPLFAQSQNEAEKILRHVDDLWRGESSSAEMTMKVKTAHYTRTLRMAAWSKGKANTLVRIISPLKEKGTATLKSGKNIFTYLPQTDRTIRLTSGMMMGSWMGSHFTNDDLVKETRREDDYEAKITFRGERAGQNVIEFTLIPKLDAAVVWGKVVLTIRSADYIPLEEVFYDEEMAVARTFRFRDLKVLGGQLRPAVMRIIPADKPEEYTEVIYETLELNLPVEEAFFSIANLKRR